MNHHFLAIKDSEIIRCCRFSPYGGSKAIRLQTVTILREAKEKIMDQYTTKERHSQIEIIGRQQ